MHLLYTCFGKYPTRMGDKVVTDDQSPAMSEKSKVVPVLN